jgi:hypothetical protein
MPLTFLPHARVDAVLDALTCLSDRLSNIGTGDKWDVLTGYLRWANDAASQLGTLVYAEGIAHLILTRRHIDALFPDAEWAVPLQDSGGHNLVRAHLFLDDPGHVRLPHADSELVDRCCALAAVAGREVTIVTFDTGMAIRARAANLAVKNCSIRNRLHAENGSRAAVLPPRAT